MKYRVREALLAIALGRLVEVTQVCFLKLTQAVWS